MQTLLLQVVGDDIVLRALFDNGARLGPDSKKTLTAWQLAQIVVLLTRTPIRSVRVRVRVETLVALKRVSRQLGIRLNVGQVRGGWLILTASRKPLIKVK